MKYRKTLPDEEMVQIITETAREISERHEIEFERMGCDNNHIHLLCSAYPKSAPSQRVKEFKSITAREIFRRKPSVKKALRVRCEFWSGGYDLATEGEVGNGSVVERSVRNQGLPREDLRQLNLFQYLRNTPCPWRGLVYWLIEQYWG
ncbi:MAG: IS200/IS605 family transposase [Candidatus Accumulibacter sp.]|nr:IS200/IS605 family transposase [Accumulibacter sp.]